MTQIFLTFDTNIFDFWHKPKPNQNQTSKKSPKFKKITKIHENHQNSRKSLKFNKIQENLLNSTKFKKITQIIGSQCYTSIFNVMLHFLDATASPSSYFRQSLGQWGSRSIQCNPVIHSFRLEIAIASPSFVINNLSQSGCFATLKALQFVLNIYTSEYIIATFIETQYFHNKGRHKLEKNIVVPALKISWGPPTANLLAPLFRAVL